MKTKLVLITISIAVVFLTASQTSNAQCYDAVPKELCKKSGSATKTILCEPINCSCPRDGIDVNGVCRKSFTVTYHWTDSLTQNWFCDNNGSTYESCKAYWGANDCFYSQERVDCPINVPGHCLPTLTYEDMSGGRLGVRVSGSCGG